MQIVSIESLKSKAFKAGEVVAPINPYCHKTASMAVLNDAIETHMKTNGDTMECLCRSDRQKVKQSFAKGWLKNISFK